MFLLSINKFKWIKSLQGEMQKRGNGSTRWSTTKHDGHLNDMDTKFPNHKLTQRVAIAGVANGWRIWIISILFAFFH